MAKSASKVFKSIRFAKLDPEHQNAGPFSTDDEEHYTVSTQEYDQQIKHVKKRAMQEDKDPCWTGYEMVGMKKKNGKPVPNCVPVKESAKEVGDDPTGSTAQETLVKKGGKTTVDKPIEEATSVAVRMQKAMNRIKEKREASEQRAKELLQPKKPEPVKEAREDDEYHSAREHNVGVVISKDNGPKERRKATVVAREPQHAVNTALNHYKSKGYTVHEHKYLGEGVDLEEGWKVVGKWHKSESDTVTDKSGAVHTAHSKVRDLARRAMKTAGEKQAKSVGAKPMKESTLSESRKTEIIKDAAKKKKAAPDKFEANPTLDSQIQKVDNT
jgi:hypothetical protein